MRTRSQEKLKEFKAIRNKLNRTLKQAKALYYNNLLTSNGRVRPDIVWKVINIILGRNKESLFLQTINVNGHELPGAQLAEYFKSHFVSLALSDEQYHQDLTTLKQTHK